jgi:hypothetical protein
LKKPQALFGLLAALGTAIGVLIAVVGLPYGRADYTAFASLYHGTVGTAGTVHVAVDCDTSNSSVQDTCNVTLGTLTTNVDVTAGNETGASIQLGAVNFVLSHTDAGILDAPTDIDALNGNPDFTADTTPAGWTCTPPDPDDDIDDNIANGEDSFLSCFNIGLTGDSIPDDTPDDTVPHNDLARVDYDIPGGGTLGSYPLILSQVTLGDQTLTEVMSCNPVVAVPGACFNATINIVEGPTNTPPPPPTVTNTPAPPTATSTPLTDSGVIKDCENSVTDANGDVACNLWICEPDADLGNDPDCDGPGEGSLRVIEIAQNVPAIPQADPNYNGLGAYEFSVEYDNFVIQSVNPCDIVFGLNGVNADGVGANRGPVDELDASSPENGDCADDAGPLSPPNNGSCNMSIVLENIIHFGCATLGFNPPGPTGSFNLASLELIPHPDLNNDLFPGNNNGVLTVIKDNGCELVDTLGHPIPGSVNGGLTILCRDLAVTVRILEGDLDLDCDVDITDAQAIASHYGAFFGGLLYSKWLDLEPQFHDLDIDIKDVQKVFGRQDSDCQDPIPAQPPANFPF